MQVAARRPSARAFRAALLALVLLLVPLAGCGSDGAGGSDGLPEVTGEVGKKPTVKAEGTPSKQLRTKVLEAGDGDEVKKGDLMVADYLGQTYAGNKVFDSSWDRGIPAAFRIGAGEVIKGWDEALVGKRTGDRVLLVVPPDKGYGAQGNEQAGIKGTDTLVFVVDIEARYPANTRPATDAVARPEPAAVPVVTGAPGAKPTIRIPRGLEPVTAPRTVLLAKGSGGPVEAARLAVVHYEAVDWTGKAVDSTWSGGPRAFPVKVSGSPGPFDALVGVPVGSRVLLLLPPSQGQQPAAAIAVVVDVIGQHGEEAA